MISWKKACGGRVEAATECYGRRREKVNQVKKQAGRKEGRKLELSRREGDEEMHRSEEAKV